MTWFDDIELGDEIGPLHITASDEAVASFCQIWGNLPPNRFTEPEVAKESGLPGPIVPGIMAMAIMSRLITGWAGPQAVRDLDLVFRQPVPHNQPLIVAATVTDTRREDGENLVECDILMTSPHGDRYVGGKAVVSLPQRDSNS